MSIILTCNAGSNNTKFATLDMQSGTRKAYKVVHGNAAEETAWLCSIGTLGIKAIGHRVVHGGTEFTHPVLITDEVVAKLEKISSLAPLHQPPALKLIREARQLYPHVPHIACFDTAFHHTIPEIERRFALPNALYEEGIKRYGFHGLSYQHVAEALPRVTGKKECRVIAAHLGGGSSACAMLDGKSVASTMGFSTLDGLIMGTRCGALDPGVVLHLLQEKKMSPDAVSDLLYHQSGLKALAGTDDMRALLAQKDAVSRDAVKIYCHAAAKQIAALVPALGGLDALVFTGGIGENAAPVREWIIHKLHWLGDFSVYVIPADEERVIGAACMELIN